MKARARSRAVTAVIAVIIAGGVVAGMTTRAAVGRSGGLSALSGGVIQHVVVVLQENHSFDELLGALCAGSPGRCDGALTGRLKTGSVIPLHPGPDISPNVIHTVKAQTTAIDGGKMDGFSQVNGCTASTSY